MQGPARILIVGDDTSTDRKLEETLTKSGFECAISGIAQGVAELCGTRQRRHLEYMDPATGR
ncbi:MAG: hypothetical protein AAGF14_07855, partial [Pseudomonadota bacterium]